MTNFENIFDVSCNLVMVVLSPYIKSRPLFTPSLILVMLHHISGPLSILVQL